jgi:two-component system sensor histidine kinase/response regulator
MTTTWAKIIGHPPDFKLEARIFNGVCFFSAIGTLFGMVSNILLGAQEIAILFLVVFSCITLCYYFSRFKGKFNTSILFYMFIINLLNIANFRYNAGINGPALLVFTLSNFLAVSIIPKKQYWFWISLNIIIVVSLLFIQYEYPQMIINHISVKERFIRQGTAYVLILFYIFAITKYIRNSYNTERELVEKHAAELELANETKHKLFSILAHDLQSPLSSIQNYLEILSELKLDNAERKSFEKNLLDSTKNTKQMVTNLLSWSKAQMSGVNVNFATIQVKDILQEIFKTYKTIAVEKKIRLDDQLKNNTLISADKDMFQLIMRNLIDNAIKFTEPGGEIIISDEINGDVCQIAIKDNGIGVPLERQGTIFSLKAASTFGTKNEKGIGLGLVLCKEYTELQNGRISFESKPGVGTTFYVSFKLATDNNANKIAEDVPKPEAFIES